MLVIKNLTKRYRVGRKWVTAVADLSLEVRRGETLGLVGESGCGKSTVARTVAGLIAPTSGELLYEGGDLQRLKGRERFEMCRTIQMIFQDPSASLNPRMRVAEILMEPLIIHRIGTPKERTERVKELLELVGLPQESLEHTPRIFSGGQRQRIALARALALNPSLLICDEPLSALDVSIQAQIVNLLQKLQRERGLTLLFIAHDLAMIKYLSDRVAVMYLGHLMEVAESEALYSHPRHPYTEALLSAIPLPDPPVERKRTRILLSGEASIASSESEGCPFKARCPYVQSLCHKLKPPLQEVAKEHRVACHFPLEKKKTS